MLKGSLKRVLFSVGCTNCESSCLASVQCFQVVHKVFHKAKAAIEIYTKFLVDSTIRPTFCISKCASSMSSIFSSTSSISSWSSSLSLSSLDKMSTNIFVVWSTRADIDTVCSTRADTIFVFCSERVSIFHRRS